ncbi:MAG: HAD-IA family hydrolase [Gammaproteobacteria bacterium]|nr:HAD-IA family hydrolase [Gammaproteobacteria bacterium]MCF6230293.1 HAD-IA family hydrolase [Gammaproteobacteria bacterium]
MNSKPTPYSVLFDLDGTLLDTAPDLAFALNSVLTHQGKAELPFETIRPVVSHGGNALIALGFSITPADPGFAPLRQQFLDIYKNNLTTHSTLFPGMEQLLAHLESQNIPWGVVTNKPAWLTDPLMDELGMSLRAACIVSGDTAEQPKPHPAPLLYACKKTGHNPADCIYIGDHQRDIEAGRRAGMKTLTALFGYIDETETPETWGADGMIEAPLDVLDYLERWKGVSAELAG